MNLKPPGPNTRVLGGVPTGVANAQDAATAIAINLGIPAITCKGIRALVNRGDKVRIDFTTGEIVDETTGATAKAEPMNEYMMGILQNGGIKPMIRKMQEEKKQEAAQRLSRSS